ncbi:Dimeric dUTPase [Caldibacillus thermoamylovorans]|uniref:dUTP diphosphatase n=1 Tax=Caldibacillus thermoamylovorans TaxID=35841 RepID=UPI0005A41B65|nr:dUTP diphosphatase [Caldibacillus thermoamylovorans]KIO60214.1 Dimeric dUTPase [Caldibacillus thermoamylovorans]
MNLQNLFELQKQLDEHIEKIHPRQEGEDRLAKKILALQVELAECAQESRCFKYWSHNQEPRLKGYKEIKCKWCNGSGDDGTGVCPDCRSSGDVYKEYNPLLEEYVDCLHFILSIGLELNIPVIYGTETKWDELTSDETDITQQFLLVFENVNKLVHPIDWINLFEEFYILGEMLGFTCEQIEQAYLDKNKINHERQENSY